MSLFCNFIIVLWVVGLYCYVVNYNKINYKFKWFVFENNVLIFVCYFDEVF